MFRNLPFCESYLSTIALPEQGFANSISIRLKSFAKNIKYQRSLFASLARPHTLRRKLSTDRGAQRSLPQLFDLNGEAKTDRTNQHSSR